MCFDEVGCESLGFFGVSFRDFSLFFTGLLRCCYLVRWREVKDPATLWVSQRLMCWQEVEIVIKYIYREAKRYLMLLLLVIDDVVLRLLLTPSQELYLFRIYLSFQPRPLRQPCNPARILHLSQPL